MIFKEIIRKKRDGLELSKEEISWAINSYTKDEIPDYQMSAFLMAAFLKGLSFNETLALTEQMLKSGKSLKFEGFKHLVDKHSTGGIGDKVSLVLSPVLAELGFNVPMLSGRALGFTGGTADKLEGVGVKVVADEELIKKSLREYGFSITTQTQDIAPADRKLYALRDATATVESIPLITASILSKKLAVETSSIVFDVKVGSGAFMKNMDRAEALGRSLVEVSKLYGRNAAALVTEMSQPLGESAGNTIEVLEALKALEGEPSEDLLEVTSSLVGLLFELESLKSFEEGKQEAEQVILSGKAHDRFSSWLKFMGAKEEKFTLAPNVVDVLSPADGFIADIDGEKLGYLIIELGGGRKRKEDVIDHGVGLRFFKKIGDKVSKGEPIGQIIYRKGDGDTFAQNFLSAYSFSESRVEKPKIIKERI